MPSNPETALAHALEHALGILPACETCGRTDRHWHPTVAARATDQAANPWRPIDTAPRDGTEVEVRSARGRVWEDAYTVIQEGGEEGWPISAIEWRAKR